jgi:predicted acyl esterase
MLLINRREYPIRGCFGKQRFCWLTTRHPGFLIFCRQVISRGVRPRRFSHSLNCIRVTRCSVLGYQLAVAMDIFRGRYRDSFEHPSAIPAGKTQEYKFTLPTVNHVFEPGHRIMVQIQSSWFPLYDRNPQKFVENIFNAKPGDYTKATQTVMRSAAEASAVWLPVVGDLK